MKIETYIDALISYATMRELIRPEDHDVAVNKLLEILQLDDYTPVSYTHLTLPTIA